MLSEPSLYEALRDLRIVRCMQCQKGLVFLGNKISQLLGRFASRVVCPTYTLSAAELPWPRIIGACDVTSNGNPSLRQVGEILGCARLHLVVHDVISYPYEKSEILKGLGIAALRANIRETADPLEFSVQGGEAKGA